MKITGCQETGIFYREVYIHQLYFFKKHTFSMNQGISKFPSALGWLFRNDAISSLVEVCWSLQLAHSYQSLFQELY